MRTTKGHPPDMDTDGNTATPQHFTPGRRAPRRARRGVISVDTASFTDRLNRLFETVYPPGRDQFSNIEVVEELAARGIDLSRAYLSQLRTGQRTQPSVVTVCALAEFFGVRPQYFSNDDPDYSELLATELHWLDIAHDPAIRNLTTALAGLPPEVRDDLLGAADRAELTTVSG